MHRLGVLLMKIHHRVGKGRLALLAGALLWSSFSQAADKLVLQTTWYAQAEQGGYYQALAQGIYKKYLAFVFENYAFNLRVILFVFL